MRFAELWNQTITTENIPKVANPSNLSAGRKKKIKARLGFNNDFEYWKLIFSKIQDIPFYRGENKSNWIVSFDYIIRNDENHTKIFERPLQKEKKRRVVV